MSFLLLSVMARELSVRTAIANDFRWQIPSLRYTQELQCDMRMSRTDRLVSCLFVEWVAD